MLTSNVFKYYIGTLGDFKTYLSELYDSNPEKYAELKKCVVFIHQQDPEDTKENIGRKITDGWMYSHGNFYSMKSINTNITIVGDGYVSVNTNDTEYTIDINSDMILNSEEYPELTRLITEGYLQEKMDYIEESIGKLDASVAGLEESVSKLDASVAGIETWKETVDSSISAIEEAIGKLDASVAGLETWKVTVDSSIAALEGKLTDASIAAWDAAEPNVIESIELNGKTFAIGDNKDASLVLSGADVKMTGYDGQIATADQTVNEALASVAAAVQAAQAGSVSSFNGAVGVIGLNGDASSYINVTNDVDASLRQNTPSKVSATIATLEVDDDMALTGNVATSGLVDDKVMTDYVNYRFSFEELNA